MNCVNCIHWRVCKKYGNTKKCDLYEAESNFIKLDFGKEKIKEIEEMIQKYNDFFAVCGIRRNINNSKS